MWSRLPKTKLVVALLASLAMLGVMACGGAEDEPVPAAAPAPAPLAPAPSAPAPAPAVAPAPAAGETMGPTLASTYADGFVKFDVPVTTPTSFNEAPWCAELVKQGKIPAVDDRLGDPLVLPPSDGIGKYGGTWRRLYLYVGDHGMNGDSDRLNVYDGNGMVIMPHLGKSTVMSPDGRSVTITLRKGHRWSDGEPFTADNWEWTFRNILENKEITPVFPSWLVSPATKNPPKFEKLDDVTIRYTWDDPYHSMAESSLTGARWSGRGGGVWWSPSHYLKNFHKDFVDAATLDKMVKDGQQESWVTLIKSKFDGYNSVDTPQTAAWKVADDQKGSEWIYERNCFYNAVDTAGNQLPYIDRQHSTLVESLDVAALKHAAGEIDLQSRHSMLQKIPLYMENQDKGGYHLTLWPEIAPTDAPIMFNQSYGLAQDGKLDDKADQYIAGLMKDRRFRMAMAYATDFEEIQQTMFQGMGVIRGYTPSRGTLYSCEECHEPEFQTMALKAKLEKANELLDELGLKKDADGKRLRADNGEPLVLHWEVREGFVTYTLPVTEVAIRNWAKVGVGGTFLVARTGASTIMQNEGYMFVDTTGGAHNPWQNCGPIIPCANWSFNFPQFGRYYFNSGTQGINVDRSEMLNPEGKNQLLRLQQILDEGKQYTMTDPKRIALGKEVFQIHTSEVFSVPTVGETPMFKGVFPTNNNLKNVPAKAVCCQSFWMDGPRPSLYFFDNATPLMPGQ